MASSRRNLLKASAAGAGLAAFAVGYSETGRHIAEGVVETLTRKAAASPNINGHSLPPEYAVDAQGHLTPHPGQYVANTMCLGCTTLCGVRVRVDRGTGRVLRVAGNPYHPLSAEPHLPYATPIGESLVALSRFKERGLVQRATTCGRGSAALEQLTNPQRVLTPLKRVGPRNGGAWQPITLEQLVAEVVEGGDLFGEGHVDGLRALRSFAPIDPDRPDLGPRTNQVAMMSSVADGRDSFAQRFMRQAFGSINVAGHGAYCGGSYRAGSGAVFGDTKLMPHARPDISNAGFVMFCGTAPGNAGNPFKRMGWEVAEQRAAGVLDYVVIDPVLGQSDNIAAGHRSRWVPIRPATDAALAMAMIRWILDNNRFDADLLSCPSAAAAAAAGETSFTNATHLVIAEPGHVREGCFLRASDLAPGDPALRYTDKDPFVVVDAHSAALVPAGDAHQAALFVDQAVQVGTASVRVRSSLDLLRDSAHSRTIEEYAAICGVPAETIVSLAETLTSHGRRAAVAVHGGTMAGNGFTSAFALLTLNTLIGNLNCKGGTLANGAPFQAEGEGPRYDLAKFDGMVKPSGTPLSRNVPYEKSSEFRAKAAAGKPYPADRPWYPTAGQLTTEWLPAALDGEPYPLKALLLWSCNPLYGVPGLRAAVAERLADPQRLKLIVAIDPLINETSAFADYIVPDSMLYETWGWAAPWGNVPTRCTTARWPAIDAAAAKSADGEPAALESFLIACARRLGLPGFGDNAIRAADGSLHPLKRAADFYLRGGANVAFADAPVPDTSDEEMQLTGVDRLRPLLESTLMPNEWRKVAYVLARGGRFGDPGSALQGDVAAHPMPRMQHLYNEAVGTSRNALTGQRNPGVPGWVAPSFADGTPMRSIHTAEQWPYLVVSQKSVLLNSYGVGLARLRDVAPSNAIAINVRDAAGLGIRTGDRVQIETPGGQVTGVALVRHGVMPGVLAIPHGYGHRELGARAHRIGEGIVRSLEGADAGVCENDLGLRDPTRQGTSVWVDPISGTAVRQGLPARLRRLAT
jgi:tetrathionate reductase subunit A